MNLINNFPHNLSPIKQLFLLFFLLNYIVISLTILLIPLVNEDKIKHLDIVAYLIGAQITTNDPTKMYNTTTQYYYQSQITKSQTQTNLLYKNPPILSLIFIPFTKLSLTQAHTVFFIVNLLLTLLLFYILSLIFDLKFISLTPLFFFYPLISTYSLGQISIIISLIIFSSILFIKYSKDFIAGATLGLLFIKPQLLIISLPLLLTTKNKTKFLFGLITTLLCLCLITINIFKSNIMVDYLTFSVNQELKEAPHRMYSFINLININNTQNFYFLFILNFLIFITIYSLLLIKKKTFNFHTQIIISILITILFSIHLLNHDLIILLYPLIYLYTIYIKNHNQQIFYLIISLLIISILSFYHLANLGGLLLFIALIYILIKPHNTTNAHKNR